MKNKIKLVLLIIFIVAVVVLAVLTLNSDSLLLRVFLQATVRLWSVWMILVIIRKIFKEHMPHSMKKALVWCGIILTLDLVIIESFRFFLSNGVSTILFFPICLPACFMIIMLLSFKDTGKESREKNITFLVGIPMLILAVYLEIYSFIQL